jgi:hypothetical protein
MKNELQKIDQQFSQLSLSEKQSFGQLTFKENWQKAETAITNINSELDKVFDRSHSQFTWKQLNLSHHSDMKNIRQISAEITSKKSALDNAKFSVLKKEAELEIKLEELENENSPAKRKLLQIEIEEIRHNNLSNIKYIEGALKDVLTLQSAYNCLMEKHQDFDESKFEEEEVKSHLKRSFAQCLRDLRQSGQYQMMKDQEGNIQGSFMGGIISKGEQEYLEQMGVNVSKALMDMRSYLKQEMESDDLSTALLHDFLEYVANKYSPCADVALKIRNLEGGFDKSLLYLKEDDL